MHLKNQVLKNILKLLNILLKNLCKAVHIFMYLMENMFVLMIKILNLSKHDLTIAKTKEV